MLEFIETEEEVTPAEVADWIFQAFYNTNATPAYRDAAYKTLGKIEAISENESHPDHDFVNEILSKYDHLYEGWLDEIDMRQYTDLAECEMEEPSWEF